jgi:hypothetical protein
MTEDSSFTSSLAAHIEGSGSPAYDVAEGGRGSLANQQETKPWATT